MGILGTVIGIIITFEGLNYADSIENFDIITQGISQALNTTAYGLLIAVVSIIFLNGYKAFVAHCLKQLRLEYNQIQISLNTYHKHRTSGTNT